GRDAAGIDAAEDAAKVRSENVGNVRGEGGHAADSVADVPATSPCRTTRSEAAAPAARSCGRRSGAETSSSSRRASCRPLLAPQAFRPRRRLGVQAPRAPAAEDAHLVGAEGAVAACVALGLGQ